MHGDEGLLVDRDVERWRAGAGGVDIEVVDAAQVDALVAGLVDAPLFAEERRVLVRELPQLTGARRSTRGDDALVRGLSMRAPTTYVCFAVRSTVAANNPLLRAIIDAGGDVVHHPRMRAPERRQWLQSELRRRSLRLPGAGADILLRCTGGDLAMMSAELDKLQSHGGSVTEDVLARLVSGTEQMELYAVVDQLAGTVPARGAALLAGLIDEGRSTQHLLSILAGQLGDVLRAHALRLRGHQGPAALAAAMRIPAWRAEKVLRAAAAVPAGVATHWLHELQRIDAGLKAGEVDDVVALRNWGIAAAAALGRRRPA